MRIGVSREIKDNEYRIGLTPSSVGELIHAGHEVLVERGAGLVNEKAELIVKVKEPLPVERTKLDF
jgi:alanine dehydrogenase